MGIGSKESTAAGYCHEKLTIHFEAEEYHAIISDLLEITIQELEANATDNVKVLLRVLQLLVGGETEPKEGH